jgi:hypothetical protein
VRAPSTGSLPASLVPSCGPKKIFSRAVRPQFGGARLDIEPSCPDAHRASIEAPAPGIALRLPASCLIGPAPYRRRRWPLLARGHMPIYEALGGLGKRVVGIVGSIEHLVGDVLWIDQTLRHGRPRNWRAIVPSCDVLHTMLIFFRVPLEPSCARSS